MSDKTDRVAGLLMKVCITVAVVSIGLAEALQSDALFYGGLSAIALCVLIVIWTL